MKFIYLISFAILFCISCNSANDKQSLSDSTIAALRSDSLSGTKIPDSISNEASTQTEIKDPIIKSGKNSESVEPKSKLNKSKIEIRTFKNDDKSGYGYDIIMDGHMYVHQPNVPALPGNNGFASEEKARQVAELVVNKIRNNIMPPTVDIKELDSLGIK